MWSEREAAPQCFSSPFCTSATLDQIVYISCDHSIYAFSTQNNRWSEVQRSFKYKHFAMVVINGKLTTVGGREDGKGTETNILLSLIPGALRRKSWKELYPPMSIKRILPGAIVVCATHMVVAGGSRDGKAGLSGVEVLNTDAMQWSTAKSLPEYAFFPQITLCEELYITTDNNVYSCSMEGLLKSCSSISSKDEQVWMKLASTPLLNTTVISLKGHLLTIGGNDKHDTPASEIYYYDKGRDCWNISGLSILSSRSRVISAVLPSKVLVVGGWQQSNIDTKDTYIGIVIDGAVLVN